MDSIKKIRINSTTYAVGDSRVDDLSETRLGPTIEIDEYGELNQSRISRAGTYGPESNDALTVPKITTDEFGRVIEVTTHSISRVKNITTGSTNGTVSVDGTDVAVSGLLDAAYKGIATSISSSSASDNYLATEKAVSDAINALIDDLKETRLGPTLSIDEDGELSLSKIRHAKNINLFGYTLNVDEFGRVADNYPLTNLINSGDSILNIVNTGIYNVASTSGITGGPIPTTSVGDIIVVFCGISSSVRLYLYHSLYNNNLYYGFKTPSINYIAWGRILITDV